MSKNRQINEMLN